MGRLAHRTSSGFTYFVTTKTWQNRALLQASDTAAILVECLFRYRDRGAYLLHEFVVMPNHLHLLLTPCKETSLERAMQLVKGGSSYEIHARRGGKMQIWHAEFHEESVRGVEDYRRKSEYIQMNPVCEHLVEKPEHWPYGSATKEFSMDAMPDRLKVITSGAKAPFLNKTCNVGVKAPTP